ncbi:uncharacterized protein conserved in archaea [Cenarchaeum symbiosum A]|uniref:D-aminoacyl-tRNA deacylase n=1 Tax=Cenarchaeum symbiosum (strain A) TaxID=414004 RepID=DTDA_CENSY|nr:RecName: Full=D-aminoacyl-tRNA deacylase; AltName: Full=D-tyrosyl-tRNA(Tyr) deacylase [Cenarchaeum symbiosum A]ABK76977.1 uncharacterized protein conserved in archaea [Cenarchaeum symbiosum A]
MDLLVAHGGDPAGSNMARYLAEGMEPDGKIWHGRHFDLVIIDSPAISADWIGGEYEYDGYVFLSRHGAESGKLALTCHSTGNFAEAQFGGSDREVAIPYPGFQRRYMRRLSERREKFNGFDITIEATHHGPTGLDKPSIFVEVGTTEKQWNDKGLCGAVAELVRETAEEQDEKTPFVICVGGTHYPEKFTDVLLKGEYALGTVVPKRALVNLDDKMFSHILERNAGAAAVLVDEGGLGPEKRRILNMLEGSGLEVISA